MKYGLVEAPFRAPNPLLLDLILGFGRVRHCWRLPLLWCCLAHVTHGQGKDGPEEGMVKTQRL